MALRDRQISGIPLTKTQSEWLSHFFTALVPVFGYNFWYPLLGVPEELWIWFAIIGIAAHLWMSVEVVPNNVERNLLWMGSYTGVSFPNGICFIPRLPFPVILFAVYVVLGEEVYRKILWSLEGDVSVQSISVPYQADGLTRDGARVRVHGMLRVEVVNAATFRSQTEGGQDRLVALIAAEYESGVKDAVISQHSADELMRGYHSAGSAVLLEWMTDAWRLVADFGVELARAPLAKVEILSKHVELAFDRAQAKEIFVEGAESLAEVYAAFKAKLPAGTSEEVALAMFNAARLDEGQAPVTINIVKFK